MADHCYVSQWHLSKLLNKHLGQSFYDQLNAVRIRQAKGLMADPALRISEVAERVGYADTAHFSRVFKKLEGVSAGEWRNMHGGSGEQARRYATRRALDSSPFFSGRSCARRQNVLCCSHPQRGSCL